MVISGAAWSLVYEHIDGVTVPAPPASHLDDVLVDHFFVLDTELAPHREVVKSLSSPIREDVEAGEVPTCIASVAGLGHSHTLTGAAISHPPE
jgi:hypothetical protein